MLAFYRPTKAAVEVYIGNVGRQTRYRRLERMVSALSVQQ